MNKKCGIIITLLLAIIIAGALKFLVLGSVVKGEDNRTVILLDAGERNHILGEMRNLLGHMQQLTSALADDDMDKVIDIANTLVKDSSGKTPTSIIAKMPLSFKTISFNLRHICVYATVKYICDALVL